MTALNEQTILDLAFSFYTLIKLHMLDLPTTEERLDNHKQQSLVRYFTLLMSLIYVGLGVYLWFATEGALTLGDTPRRLLAAVFIFYGIIRFVRTYRQHFKKTRDDVR